MSTALAIASVTQVLKDLLDNGLIDYDVTGTLGGDVTVTCLPPDLVESSRPGQTLLNLFMYHVTPNTGWSNQGFPSLDSTGIRVSNPPLALNLHYLLTAYSKEELHIDILLGYAMQLFHENPVLARDAIRRSLSVQSITNPTGLPVSLRALSTSKLAEQVEQVKITPQFMNTEELSKLWTAFQAKYRPSVAYMATVVLIESTRSTKTALPVKGRNIYVKPFNQPVIEKIRSQAISTSVIVDDQKILQGFLLVIAGTGLKTDILTISIDGTDSNGIISDASDTQIIFQLPADLAAGIHGLQVTGKINMGTPEELHRGVESNVETFTLSPVIVTAAINQLQGTGTALRSGKIELKVRPAIGPQQQVNLLLNQFDNAAGTIPLAYSFQASVSLSSTPAEDILIPFSDVKDGTYLVRIQVDTAESPLDVIISSSSDTGSYNSPLLIIP